MHYQAILPNTLQNWLHTGGYARSEEVVEEALREHQARRQDREIFATSGLERLLDEGLENLKDAKTTEQLRRPQ